jgi:hypothetical protein
MGGAYIYTSGVITAHFAHKSCRQKWKHENTMDKDGKRELKGEETKEVEVVTRKAFDKEKQEEKINT